MLPALMLVHLEGVEPTSSAYQADALPLSYKWVEGAMGLAPTVSSLATRRVAPTLRARMLVAPAGFEPAPSGSKPEMLPLHHGAVVPT